jgi:multicomponent Na+:H+ antiporter subunit F
MEPFYASLALFLFLNIAVGLIRVVRGPTRSDRMLAAQLFGTTGVAVLLILAVAMEQPALQDVALVFALLATVATAAFGYLVAKKRGSSP